MELTPEVIKKRTLSGVAILTGRTIFIQAISFASTALLTVFLSPSDFGIFFLVSAVVNFLAYFGDIGFAAALIQKKENLSKVELRTVFTTQQMLVLLILLIVFITTPIIKNFYNLGDEAVYLFWAFAFSLFLSSLKTIPTVLMERKLEFNKWVVPQIIETIIFNVVAVYLAYSGFGVTSFTVAVLLRSFSGLIVTYLLAPWLPGISFSPKTLKSILKFGVPYQANTLLAMVKDDGMILFLGGVLGTSGIGLLGWAQKWAYAPLRFFMDQVIKVTFPAFSRLQDKKEELSNAVTKSMFFVCFLVFPTLVFLIFASSTLIEIIPKYDKWEPALIALYILAITSGLAAVTTPLTNTLNAIGKISITFKLMIMWTCLTWIFVPYLAISYGVFGAALGFTLVGLTSIIALFLISKYIKIDYLQSVGKPLLGTLVMGALIFFIKLIVPSSFLQIILMAIFGFISYLLIMVILDRNLLSKLILSAIFLFFLLVCPVEIFAQTNSYASIVNPIRGEDFWEQEGQKIDEVVKGQAEILSKFNIPATWLIRFDALDERQVVDVVLGRLQDEKGIFLEITPTWAKAAKVKYHESDNWHEAGSAFLSGYEREERVKLIDSAFEKFKSIFGFYPKSVGAWWIDSYSLEYMQKEYGITGALIVSDQYTTDNYQIWGQYFGVPYYPSKKHALHPAQTKEAKLPVVIMQWASRDPVNGYGRGVEDSTFSVQANDYIDYHSLNTNYFSSLVDIYTKQQVNPFGHIVSGLENSYSWEKYKGEYENQIKTLTGKQAGGQLKIVTMQEFASWYSQTFPNLSPKHLIVADDLLGSSKKAVWFMNPYYRAGWFFSSDGSVFRDIRQYIEGEEELCYLKACSEVNFATFATRVLDEVSFGHKKILDEGKISDFDVKKLQDGYVVSYKNEAGNLREVEFLPRDISIDGKISSIDGIILETTRYQLDEQKEQVFLEQGSFKWSLANVLTKTIKFLGFIILGCLIPGLLLLNRVFTRGTGFLQKATLSIILGFSLVTLLFYVLSIFRLKQAIFVYLIINFIILVKIRKQILGNFSKKLKDKFNLLIAGLIGIGTIFQSLPTFKNGLNFPYGLGFWGPNTHDGLWHVALINQLTKEVPPENPIFSGEVLKNYHYFYDLLVAATNYVTGIDIMDLVFRFYPLIFSLLLGIGSYYLILSFYKSKIAGFFSLYLVYFAGSFGWIVEYIKFRHLGGESAFWANQSISFNLNPPFAISLLIVIAILLLLPNIKSKLSIAPVTILSGTLIAFKAYGAILILASLLLVGILKRNLAFILVFLFSAILSAILFLSNFSFAQQLIIFSPFWFIHSMIDSPDRVGWVRLSLARTAGLEMGNYFKFAAAEVVSFLIFLIGNLGTRAFALLTLLKIKDIVRRVDHLFIFIFSAISLLIPTLFIQAGNPWNTIQFLYYFLYTSSLTAGVILSKIYFKLPLKFALTLILVILFITPINSWATANGYLSYNPHAFISKEEAEALKFLGSLEEGVVLTYPYDPKLKNKIAEPWPIYVYDSTAYVSALSGKRVFMEDEGQNQILLTDLKKRKVLADDFFSGADSEFSKIFLKENNIKFIYLPKIFLTSLDEGKLGLLQIFENSEVKIYKL